MQVEAALALQPPRAGGELGDRNAAGLVDVERDRLHLAHRLGDLLEVVLGDVAAADLVGGHARLLGDDAGGELLGRHFEREEADHAAVDRRRRSVRPGLAAIGLGDVEGDVGRQRRLAHAGAAGEDDEVGGLQAAHVAVEIGKAGGDARQTAVALVSLGRHVDGGLERVGEALEAAVVAAALGDGVEAPLRFLDLVARARIDRRVIGDVDHVLADLDQLAANREVVDGAAVVEGVDDRRRLGGEAGEILLHGDAAEVVLAEEGLERDRRGDLAGADQRAGDLVDAAVDLLDEVLGLEEIGDAVEGVVVDQDRAEQRLLGLDVERRAAIGALARIGGGEPAGEIFDSRHGALRNRVCDRKCCERERDATKREG